MFIFLDKIYNAPWIKYTPSALVEVSPFTDYRWGFRMNFLHFFRSIWDSLVLLNNAFFCMWWRDKVALNVSSHPIRGLSLSGARWAASEHATVAVEVTFMLRWANIFQVTFFNYTERQVPQATNPPATTTQAHTHTLPHMHSHKQTNLLTLPPFTMPFPHTTPHPVFSSTASSPPPQIFKTHKHSSDLGRKGKLC